MMTTSHSPLRVLKAQADRIAQTLKAAERGEITPAQDPTGKIAASRGKESVKFAVAMDDKLFTIEMPWETIRSSSEAGLAEFVLKEMRGKREAVH